MDNYVLRNFTNNNKKMNYTDVTILHTNDMHSYMENFPKKAQYIKDVRVDNDAKGIKTFLFDSGDLFSGSVFFTMYSGVKEIELMNLIGCQAMTLGNHEFDHGDDMLSRLNDFAQFPIVSSNLSYRNQDFSEELVPIHHILEFDMGDQPLYVLGLTTPETQQVASPTANIMFTDPLKSLQQQLDVIQEKAPQAIVVLLSHMGYEEDLGLAKTFPDLNIILGGHTHTVLRQPTVVGQTAVLQAGQYGLYLGRLDLRCYEDGSYEILSYELIEIDQLVAEDREVKMIIDQMRKDRDAQFDSPITSLPYHLDGERDSIRQGKSSLAPIITEALFNRAQSFGFKVDGAVINGFGIRTSLSAGPVYQTDLI